MKVKRVISSVLLVIWMFVIFSFSNQNGNVSEGNSDKVAAQVIDTVTTITKQEITENEKKTMIEDTRFLVRKIAHFSSYFILNLLAYFTLKSFGVKNSILYSILFSFFFACTDEIHQLFVSERAGRLLDVVIDTAGACISSGCIFVTQKLFYKKKA